MVLLVLVSVLLLLLLIISLDCGEGKGRETETEKRERFEPVGGILRGRRARQPVGRVGSQFILEDGSVVGRWIVRRSPSSSTQPPGTAAIMQNRPSSIAATRARTSPQVVVIAGQRERRPRQVCGEHGRSGESQAACIIRPEHEARVQNYRDRGVTWEDFRKSHPSPPHLQPGQDSQTVELDQLLTVLRN